MTAAETGTHFSAIVDRVQDGDERIIVERDGSAVAAVISARDLERFEKYERQREADFAIIDEIRAAFRDVPPKERERKAAHSVAEARADLRARRLVAREHAIENPHRA